MFVSSEIRTQQICPRYYHRSLNVAKLVDVRFTYIPRHLTLARLIRSNKLPAVPHLSRNSGGLREMEERDIAQVCELFTRYMQRFGMAPVMTLDEMRHQFLSGKGKGDRAPGTWKGRREGQVVWPYVIEVCVARYWKLSVRWSPCPVGFTSTQDYGFLLDVYSPIDYHW